MTHPLRRLLLVLALALPLPALADVLAREQLVGDWIWLGNAAEPATDPARLLRTGPSIKRFLADGTYWYVPVHEGREGTPVAGTWSLAGDILTVTRPDNGTFRNRVLSFRDGVLETQAIETDVFSYMRRR